MKKFLLLLFSCWLLFSSCKKGDSNSGTGNKLITHTPNLITIAYVPGEPIDALSFHIYDLDHDDNKDKKFFKVKFKTVDSASMEMGPRTIDSLGTGWPSEVKQVSFGSGAEFIVNRQFYLNLSSGSFRKINYSVTNPQHAWYSLSLSAGSSAVPDAELTFGPSDYRIFYFSTGQVSTYINNKTVLVDMGSVAGLGQAFGAYSWKNVTEVIYNPRLLRLYFFDFKNWTYWSLFRDPSFNYEWIAEAPRSLDRFVKWPEGWGKK